MASEISGNKSDGPVYFWRETEVPFGFLSQWYESPFEVDGVTYQSTEMWMMLQKARVFNDKEIEEKIIATTSPKEHKALGRKVKGFDGKMWDQHKDRIVEEGNRNKFTKGKESAEMAKKLLQTGDRELVEASPYDRIWGVGFSAKTADKNRDKWGENRLGIAMMKVRDELRKGAG